MTADGPSFLFDAHHLGGGQTGNETWTRNIAIAMRDLGAEGRLQFAVTSDGLPLLRRFTNAPAHVVSASSARRLAVDVPRLVRANGCRAVLVTYTEPLTRCPAVVAVHDVSPWHREARAWLGRTAALRHRVTDGISIRRAARVIVPDRGHQGRHRRPARHPTRTHLGGRVRRRPGAGQAPRRR